MTKAEFLAQLTPPNARGCREWSGAKQPPPRQYGTVWFGGCFWGAHRLAWFFAHGPIPVGLHVLHDCDNPPCCEPTHLFLGTRSDNMRDMHRKGRGRSKLTAEDVAKIRDDSRFLREIAADYGVSVSLVSAVRRGRVWANV